MRRSASYILRTALLAVLMILAVSCRYKELCLNHPHTAPFRIEVDWSESRYQHFDEGQLPSGMTIGIFRKDKVADPVYALSNDIHTATLNLEEGVYDLMVFDYSFNEFGSLEFQGRDCWDELVARSVESRSKWYSKTNPTEMTTRNPEWLAVARAEEIWVTKDMITMRGRSISSRAGRQTAALNRENVLTMYPHAANHNVRVIVRANGFHNLASIRSVIKGFAHGYYLGGDEYTEESVGYAFNGWTPQGCPEDESKGNVSTVFQTFDLPWGFEGKAEEVTLYLECLLIDGKTIKTFEFNVGDKIREVTEDEAIDYEIEVEVDLPNVPPPGYSTGGFAITVDDWDEEMLQGVDIM